MDKKQGANPYEDWEEYLEEHERQRLNSIRESVDMTKRHTDVFKPKNIREFEKHMDARSRAKNISNLCIGVGVIVITSAVIYLFIDINLTTLPFIGIYAIIMIFLAVMINIEKR